MKKYDICNDMRDTQISIKVKVPEVNREFKFKLFKKTRVKELGMKLSELLNLDPIRTNVQLYGPGSFSDLNEASTLLQNFLENGSVVIAKVHNTGKSTNISTFYKEVSKKSSFGTMSPLDTYVPEEQYPAYSLKTHAEFYGMKATGVCTNPNCVSYNKEVTFPYGTGTFDINQVLKATLCQTCPYKDKALQKAIIVKEIVLTNCYWRLEGHYFDSNGFFNYKYMKGWVKTEGIDYKSFYRKLAETKYTDPKLYVKAL